MDETDILEYHCQICQQSYTSLWALSRHIKRDHTTPREGNLWGVVFLGAIIAVAPSVVLGAIVTWALWDIKAHNAAVIVGLITFLAVMWMGGWVANIVGSAEEKER